MDGCAVLGCVDWRCRAGFICIFYSACYFLWYATGPLLDAELRQGKFLKSGIGLAGFLICVVSVIWVLSRGRDAMGRFLADEEEAQ